jgi:hypothetical protein
MLAVHAYPLGKDISVIISYIYLVATVRCCISDLILTQNLPGTQIAGVKMGCDSNEASKL